MKKIGIIGGSGRAEIPPGSALTGRNFYKKCRELISYGIIGGMVTLLNIALYAFFVNILSLHYLMSTAAAFVLATLFAFFGNKYIVFRSGKKDFASEMIVFFVLRLLMGILDFSIMYVSVDWLKLNDFIMKIISDIVVIIGNYLCSKFLVFREKTPHES
jgi:putative flippase GtrA